MTFKEITDWCAGLLDQVADQIETEGAPRPHVYRWWTRGMALPAAFIWGQGSQDTKVLDSCSVRDTVTITLSFMLRPAESEGVDMLNAETVLDVALPIVDVACRTLSAKPGIKSRVKRKGFRTVLDTPGASDSEQCLVVEIPIEIPWTHHTDPQEQP